MQATEMTLVPQYEVNYLNANLGHLQAIKQTSDEAHMTQGTKFRRLDLFLHYSRSTLTHLHI